MSIEQIIEKYNYNLELSNFLRSVYPILCVYFGDENLVFNALNSTPIVLCSNVYDYLFKNNMLDADGTAVVDKASLKQAAGAYCSKPNIKYENLENKYTVTNVSRVVAINASTLENDSTKSTLIHEICHLIKSCHNEYLIKDDTLIEKSGLITSIYQLNYENGQVKKTLVFEHNVGLEEGLNTLAQDEIASKLLGKDFGSFGYGIVKALAKDVVHLSDNIYDEIMKAELYHDESKLKMQFGESFYKLMEFGDKLYKLNLEVMNFSLTEDERKLKADEIRKYVAENLKLRRVLLVKLVL